ncbi:MAG: type I-F CRISPR-associated protein Csy3 [Zoogloeaceae bacterium]|nr:type I-F CRISPR-associated protein Csy3 [Zoogloeaceae bacterium]
MAKTKTTLTTASVLAFERKLDPSDGLFSAGRWAEMANGAHWPAIVIHEKSVRGTISNRLKTKEQDPAKLDAAIESPNLQRVDVATLPNDADTLRVRFTLRVLGGAGTPSACNNADYQAQLQQTVAAYVAEQGFGELARRYAYNLVNGRFLWRNRVGAEQVQVEVNHLKESKVAQSWAFDAMSFSLRGFDAPAGADADLAALAAVIDDGLAGQAYVLLEVVAYARVGDGQEVYPSQELILDKGDKKGQKSRTLYGIGPEKSQTAALHSQKIGNALRTIDTWYPVEVGEALGPIAVEPYGSVTNQGKAYRQPKAGVDFYNLLDAWVLKGQAPKNEGDRHFVMATLIRGGVFGDSDKE